MCVKARQRKHVDITGNERRGVPMTNYYYYCCLTPHHKYMQFARKGGLEGSERAFERGRGNERCMREKQVFFRKKKGGGVRATKG